MATQKSGGTKKSTIKPVAKPVTKPKAAAKPARPKKAATLEYVFGDITVSCTNEHRVMFPDDNITKAEVIGHYHRVADVMLPEVRDRPLSVERFTGSIAQGGFFMKHYQKHYPDWLDSVTLGTKTRVTYPVIHDAAGLVYMANQGSIAMHIGTSRQHTQDTPDLLVFDLDPPEGNFEIVRKTAKLFKELFESVGLRAFVKTTGGKGLHVVAPLDSTGTYDEVRTVCSRMARIMCARHPDVVTLEVSKKARAGRLYLDLMRNVLGATMVAPYSLRGRPGAPVSAPIKWKELDAKGFAANAIKLRDMPERLETVGDPWAKLRETEGSIEAVAAALDELDDELPADDDE